MIELTDISAGDIVTLQDKAKNVVMGEVVQGSEGQLFIIVFGHPITFARPNRNGTLVLHPGIRVVGHVPTLFV